MTTYAKISSNEAWLGKPFGESLARRFFGDETVDALPKNVRGKWQGKFKASIRWNKVESGGWVKTGAGFDGERGAGYVERRVGQIISAQLFSRAWDSNDETIFATWEKAK